ncbi:hypothetical protein LAZ67_3002608 [Cordylochernes scorpioides]|uniref:Mos1 transposase HTH domain-containing protein n=1 Tax=Cordylochernes scorpioides TaxID=51811 RepID=A0ABY6K7Y3_9ARAC|nr:hypothetical protein LAZ67_3002608 [Cordylochernes scorpioides]
MSKSRIKTMIIVFFDIRGIVHCEFVPQGQTVNSAFYLEVLRRLKRRIIRVMTDIKDTVKLHHDNATSHTAFIITNFLARSNNPVIPHPPYSPDLAPCDLFLFPRLKREMKGKHWETVENIQHHVTTFLRSIPVEEFQDAFQAWQTRLRKCIDGRGIVRGDTCLRLKCVFNFCNIARGESLEQRYAIKFCVRLGENATETFQMLQKAFKDDCISRSQSGKWHKAFKEGREEVADEPRSGRPTTARTDESWIVCSKFCVPTVD